MSITWYENILSVIYVDDLLHHGRFHWDIFENNDKPSTTYLSNKN